MNTLSWFLYFAGIAQELKVLVIIIGSIFGIGGGMMLLFSLVEQAKPVFSPTKPLIVGLVLLLFGALLPSSNTIYAIAVSEMGEKVVMSETGQKALEAVNRWISKQLAH